ncbi:MAG: DNA primase [Chlamydiales bacterium]
MFTKDSLSKLREEVDLIEVLNPHVEFKRIGSVYKALCPFHQEKTPSFVVQKGQSYYHCFGCGVHGDAVQFLMSYLNLSFVEAVESLSERFHLPLEREDKKHEKGVNKTLLKECLTTASRFFHEYLLFSAEGRKALQYLFSRGITLDFIRTFEIGYAPVSSLLFQVIKEKEILMDTGLLQESGHLFFRQRITFPIRDHLGDVIGFSARKIDETTFGGKYINTPETSLFKKSRHLFGLNYSRRRIAKERRVLLVEGQIDCLRLIESGLDLTVAALGTAFGEGHLNFLRQLGIRKAYILFDSDHAGISAASKVGDLFQKRGIEALIVHFPTGYDPDTFLTTFGVEPLFPLLDQAENYLSFQLTFLSQQIDLHSPSGKAEIVKNLKLQIETWEDPIMVHETLRKLASMLELPEEMVGIKQNFSSNFFIKHKGIHPLQPFDPDRILEMDLLRWLILMGEKFYQTARHYLKPSYFFVPVCRLIFEKIIENEKVDLLILATQLEDPLVIDEILKKKVNKERAEVHFLETIQKILDRNWMQTREEIKRKMHNGKYSEEEILELAKRFDGLKREVCIEFI